jgi:ABC-type lipoprotein release transport system permease subunit
MIGVSVLMLVVTTIAVLIPSIKAMRIDPALLLKEE